MMKKSAHQSSNEIIPANQMNLQEDSRADSSKLGRTRKNTYVKYIQKYSTSGQKNNYDSRK